MKKIFTLFFMLCVVFLSFSGIANAITLSERDELNNATPGTQKVGLGTLMRSQLAVGVVRLETGDTSSSAVQIIPCSVEPSGDTGYVRKLTGSAGGDSVALVDCNPGQTMTISLVNDGGNNFTITPDTSSGWADVTLADVGDNITIRFVNATVGWVVVGTADTTSGPVLSAPINPFN